MEKKDIKITITEEVSRSISLRNIEEQRIFWTSERMDRIHVKETIDELIADADTELARLDTLELKITPIVDAEFVR